MDHRDTPQYVQSLNTGTEVTAVSDDTYRSLGFTGLQQPSKVLPFNNFALYTKLMSMGVTRSFSYFYVLSPRVSFWQEQAFDKIKTELSQPTLLEHYNQCAPTKISPEGAVILQWVGKKSRNRLTPNEPSTDHLSPGELLQDPKQEVMLNPLRDSI